MEKSYKIGVLGAGSWGTALAALLCKNGHEVTLWSISKDEVEMLNEKREHVTKLKGLKLDESIKIINRLEEAVVDKEIMVMAVPSSYIRSTSELVKEFIVKGQIIVNVAKGFEYDTLFTLQEVINDVLPDNDVVVLSGPSHAEEVAKNVPTSVVVSSKNPDIIKSVQDVFMNERFRVYGSNDITGVEIGGAFKNVIALAAGIADGLEYGDNTKAALMTRGIAEISRLGQAMGADRLTFNGLSGIGDLIVTCTSMHSRNRRAGILIGKGYTVEEATDEVKMVIEGVFAAKAGLKLSEKYDVELPIIQKVYEVLFENKPADLAVEELMIRDKKYEH